MCCRINSFECKTEKRNSQCEQGQPMEQTRRLFCTCDPGVARCQLQHKCHFWRMNLMFEAYCTRQVSLAAVNQIYVIQLQKSKDSLKACFENVNMKMGLK